MTRTVTAPLIVFVLMSFAAPRTGTASADAWEAMARPGAIAVMRHAYAPGYSDPSNFRLDDCATQRNLNDEGRDQARRIGAAFRENGIEIDRVLTSQWCRSSETAELLGLGTVEPLPSLNSFFEARHLRDEQTRATIEFLRNQPEDQRMVLVSHQVNISALTGRGTASGEFIIIDITPDGEVEILGEILMRH